MYLKQTVEIPRDIPGITLKTIKGTTYVYYAYDRKYSAEKKYTVPNNTTIGKCTEEGSGYMYPNTNFMKFFPDIEIPEKDETNRDVYRSGCLKIGTYLVLKKIITEYGLDKMLEDIIGKDAGLFLDLAAYSIITEDNAAQYYPDYTFNHPLFTDKMRMYSDSKVSDFLNSITVDHSIEFQSQWNNSRDYRERIYISYDSTNKNCQAGDIDLVEFGHPKEDTGAPVVNYSIAYDTNNSMPLFYEAYPGSIVDVSQLQFMLETAMDYGYTNVGFILDRGYFSKPNIRYMDKCGYGFVIMVKGMKDLVSETVLEVKGTFEEDRKYSIRGHRVSGITVKKRLYPSDENDRYFHVFYSENKRASEHESIESKIDDIEDTVKKYIGKKYRPHKSFEKYFDFIYSHEGEEDEMFLGGTEKYDVINAEIKLCGYFVIITSDEMTAEEAIDLYKSRDASEKLFRGDKSYLGNKAFRTHSSKSTKAKIFIEFIALIIRNRFHQYIRKQRISNGNRQNYLTVPAAIGQLEKIEMIGFNDKGYHLSHAVTATQKEILKAFGMTAADVRVQAAKLSKELVQIENGDS